MSEHIVPISNMENDYPEELLYSPNVKHVVNLSGGKDSGATALTTIEKGIDAIYVFADTGNEHQITYDYLEYLEYKLGIEIKRIRTDFSQRIENKRKFIAADRRPKKKNHKGRWIPLRWKNNQKRISLKALRPTGNPFLDLCAWKGRFPSRMASFCTENLKRIPIYDEVIAPLLDEEAIVLSWQGVRREESKRRSTAMMFEQDKSIGGNLFSFRPIVSWTHQEVFAMHKRHGIEPNPLYKKGFSRVGCMPCINCSKSELHLISKHFPEVIERIRQWEKHVSMCSKRRRSTFFHSDKIPGEGGDRAHINNAVKWSKTIRGGKQYSLTKYIDNDQHNECTSVYGLCE